MYKYCQVIILPDIEVTGKICLTLNDVMIIALHQHQSNNTRKNKMIKTLENGNVIEMQQENGNYFFDCQIGELSVNVDFINGKFAVILFSDASELFNDELKCELIKMMEG